MGHCTACWPVSCCQLWARRTERIIFPFLLKNHKSQVIFGSKVNSVFLAGNLYFHTLPVIAVSGEKINESAGVLVCSLAKAKFLVQTGCDMRLIKGMAHQSESLSYDYGLPGVVTSLVRYKL